MRTLYFSSILILIFALQGCLHRAKPSDNTIRLNGFTASVPPDAGWIRTESSPNGVTFERAKNGEKTALRFSVDNIEPQPQDQTFFQLAESRQEQTFASLKMISLHYTRTNIENAPCLEYDGIFENMAIQATPFSTIRGLICRHPDTADLILQVELSQLSDSQTTAYTVDLTEAARKVFDAVQFTKSSKVH